jgi:hypothetical protein
MSGEENKLEKTSRKPRCIRIKDPEKFKRGYLLVQRMIKEGKFAVTPEEHWNYVLKQAEAHGGIICDLFSYMPLKKENYNPNKK